MEKSENSSVILNKTSENDKFLSEVRAEAIVTGQPEIENPRVEPPTESVLTSVGSAEAGRNVQIKGKTKRKISVKRKISFDRLAEDVMDDEEDSDVDAENTPDNNVISKITTNENTPEFVWKARRQLSDKLSELINKVETSIGKKAEDVAETANDVQNEDNSGDDYSSDSSDGRSDSDMSSSDEPAEEKNRPRTIRILRREAFVGSATKKSPYVSSSDEKERTSNHVTTSDLTSLKDRSGHVSPTEADDANSQDGVQTVSVERRSVDVTPGDNHENVTLGEMVDSKQNRDSQQDSADDIEKSDGEVNLECSTIERESCIITRSTSTENFSENVELERGLTEVKDARSDCVMTGDAVEENKGNGLLGRSVEQPKSDEDCGIPNAGSGNAFKPSESNSVDEQHKALQQFERPGSPGRKKKSAFVDEGLDSYLEKYEKTSMEKSNLAKTPKICTSVDDMDHVEIDGYRFYMFKTKKELKEHVLATTVSKITSGKWSYERTSETTKVKGWRKRFGSNEKVRISHVGTRRNWVASRKLVHGMKQKPLAKLGFRLGDRMDEESVAHIEPLIIDPDEKYAHMKINAHKLAPAGKITIPVLQKALKTLSQIFLDATGCPAGYKKLAGDTSVLAGKYRVESESEQKTPEEISLSDADVSSADKAPEKKLDNSFEIERTRTSDVQYDYDDTNVPVARALPEMMSSADGSSCVKDCCRLGCVCASLQKSNWKKIVDKNHCGEPGCMFGCTCKEWRRIEQGKKAIWDGVAVLDDDGRFYDSSGKLRSSRTSRPSKAALAAFETEEYFGSIYKRKSKTSRPSTPSEAFGSTGPVQRAKSPADAVQNTTATKQPKTRTKSETELPQKAFVEPDSSKETGRPEMESIKSDLRGMQVKQDKIEELLEKIVGKAQVEKESETGMDSSDSDSKRERSEAVAESRVLRRTSRSSSDETTSGAVRTGLKSDFQSRLAVLKNYNTAVPLKIVDKEGRIETRLVHSLGKRVDSPDLEGGREKVDDEDLKDLDIGRLLDDEDATGTCARTTVYVPVRLRQHNTNTAPRYDSTMPEPVTVAPVPDDMQQGEEKQIIDVEKVVDVQKKRPEKFKVQMVLLQRKSQRENEENVPHLLEIHSNCHWDGIRSQILGKVSVVADVGKYPAETELTVGDRHQKYLVTILPRGAKPTKIPQHLTKILKTNLMYAIRIKITLASKAVAIGDAASGDDADDVQIIREEKFGSRGLPDVKPNVSGQSYQTGLSALSSLNVNTPGMFKMEGGGLSCGSAADTEEKSTAQKSPASTGENVNTPKVLTMKVSPEKQGAAPSAAGAGGGATGKQLRLPLSMIYNSILQQQRGNVVRPATSLLTAGKQACTIPPRVVAVRATRPLASSKSAPQPVSFSLNSLPPTGLPAADGSKIALQTMKLPNGQSVYLVPLSAAPAGAKSTELIPTTAGAAMTQGATTGVTSQCKTSTVKGKPAVTATAYPRIAPRVLPGALCPAASVIVRDAKGNIVFQQATGLSNALGNAVKLPQVGVPLSSAAPIFITSTTQNGALPGVHAPLGSKGSKSQGSVTNTVLSNLITSKPNLASILNAPVGGTNAEKKEQKVTSCARGSESPRESKVIESESQESDSGEDSSPECETKVEGTNIILTSSKNLASRRDIETDCVNDKAQSSSNVSENSAKASLNVQTSRPERKSPSGEKDQSSAATCKSNEASNKTDPDKNKSGKSPVSQTELALIASYYLDEYLKLHSDDYEFDIAKKAEGSPATTTDEAREMTEKCRRVCHSLKQLTTSIDQGNLLSFVDAYSAASSQMEKILAILNYMPHGNSEEAELTCTTAVQAVDKCERVARELLERNLGVDAIRFYPKKLLSGCFEVFCLERDNGVGSVTSDTPSTQPQSQSSNEDSNTASSVSSEGVDLMNETADSIKHVRGNRKLSDGSADGASRSSSPERKRRKTVKDESSCSGESCGSVDGDKLLDCQTDLIKERLLPQLQNIVKNYSQNLKNLQKGTLEPAQVAKSNSPTNFLLDVDDECIQKKTADVVKTVKENPLAEETPSESNAIEMKPAASVEAESEANKNYPGFYIADNPHVTYKGSLLKRSRAAVRDMILNHPDPKRVVEMLAHTQFDEEEIDIDDDDDVGGETAASRLRQADGSWTSGKSRAQAATLRPAMKKKRKQGLETRTLEEADASLQFVEELVCVESKDARKLDNAHLLRGVGNGEERETGTEKKSLALHCVRERHRRLELANCVAELAALCCPTSALQFTPDGKLKTPKHEVMQYGILTIHNLHKEHKRLKEIQQQQQTIRAKLVHRLKVLKTRLRNQFAGVTRDETTGATIVCEEPD